MKANKTLIVAGISAIALGTTYFVWNYFHKKKKPTITPPVTPPTTGGSTALSTSFPIKFGTFNNQNVVVLQKAIKVTADGDWGKITEGKMKDLGHPNKTFTSKTQLDQFIFEVAFGSTEDTPTYYTLP
jgi:hypothetical protein